MNSCWHVSLFKICDSVSCSCPGLLVHLPSDSTVLFCSWQITTAWPWVPSLCVVSTAGFDKVWINDKFSTQWTSGKADSAQPWQVDVHPQRLNWGESPCWHSDLAGLNWWFDMLVKALAINQNSTDQTVWVFDFAHGYCVRHFTSEIYFSTS